MRRVLVDLGIVLAFVAALLATEPLAALATGWR